MFCCGTLDGSKEIRVEWIEGIICPECQFKLNPEPLVFLSRCLLMEAACRASTRYSIQSVWTQAVPAGGGGRSPLGIIRLSNMSAPHRDGFGAVLGASPPPPASSLCFSLSGPVPISKPWGADSSTHDHWGSHACPGSSFFLSAEPKEPVGAESELLLGVQVSTAFSLNTPPLIRYTAEHKQGSERMFVHPQHEAEEVNLSLRGWRRRERSFCFTAVTVRLNSELQMLLVMRTALSREQVQFSSLKTQPSI